MILLISIASGSSSLNLCACPMILKMFKDTISSLIDIHTSMYLPDPHLVVARPPLRARLGWTNNRMHPSIQFHWCRKRRRLYLIRIVADGAPVTMRPSVYFPRPGGGPSATDNHHYVHRRGDAELVRYKKLSSQIGRYLSRLGFTHRPRHYVSIWKCQVTYSPLSER